MFSKKRSKRGQVWVETVIYTLIGMAVIGLVLAGALPKINQKRDEMAIENSIQAMTVIDEKIYEVAQAVQNRRVVNLEIKKGSFFVNPAQDTISWRIPSSFAYSEVGQSVPFGSMNITTTEDGGSYEVELEFSYNLNFVYENDDFREEQFDAAPTPYRIVFENMGKDVRGDIVIAISEA
jgi:type II secretory pathway pseudopilin PulG